MPNSHRLTIYILVAAFAGVAVGHLCHSVIDWPGGQQQVADYLSIVTDLFLRLIKMIIAPLVFATLVAGIANMGGSGSLSRIGLRTVLWFIAAGLVSLLLGIAMVHLLKPGIGLNLPLPAQSAADISAGANFDLRTFITHIVPTSIFDALGANALLQIVVFSLFTGVALAALGPRGAVLVRGVDALVHVMLKITEYVMRVAPIAVFASIAAVVTTQGLAILLTFGKFIAGFYLSLLVLWTLLAIAGYVVLGPPIGSLIRSVREPILLAFATASSEAAYPKTLEQLERVGIPRSIASFVLPLGYSFNLDGSMMYCAFALMFIAQIYGIDLTLGQQITMLLLLMVMSKGLAGVPRASLVVIAAALPHFDLPEAGLLLILGIDQFLDMGRTATNVVGNSVATGVVAKWEGVTIQAPEPGSRSSQACSIERSV